MLSFVVLYRYEAAKPRIYICILFRLFIDHGKKKKKIYKIINEERQRGSENIVENRHLYRQRHIRLKGRRPNYYE